MEEEKLQNQSISDNQPDQETQEGIDASQQENAVLKEAQEAEQPEQTQQVETPESEDVPLTSLEDDGELIQEEPCGSVEDENTMEITSADEQSLEPLTAEEAKPQEVDASSVHTTPEDEIETNVTAVESITAEESITTEEIPTCEVEETIEADTLLEAEEPIEAEESIETEEPIEAEEPIETEEPIEAEESIETDVTPEEETVLAENAIAEEDTNIEEESATEEESIVPEQGADEKEAAEVVSSGKVSAIANVATKAFVIQTWQIAVAAVIVVALVVGGILLGTILGNQSAPDPIVDYTGPLVNNKPGDPSSIALPGYPALVFSANTQKVTLELPNPSGNPCYFQYTLTVVETGDELYRSALLEPGKMVKDITLNRTLSAGTYTLRITVDTFSLSDGTTPMNGGVQEVKLTVK